MNVVSSLFKTEVTVTLITWLVLASSGLVIGFSYFHSAPWRWWLALTAYLIFLVGFMATIRERKYKHDNTTRLCMMAVQLVAIYSCFFLLPYTFNAVLLTMWSALLVYWLPFVGAALFSVITALPFGLLMSTYWQHGSSWLTTLMFWTFSLFAMMMIDTSRREAKAREEVERVNRELVMAHAMLESASREQERTKIARNIHDLLGHHLTALSIHLQVLHRQAQQLPQQSDTESFVDNTKRCHSIARLLLQDVREAVTDIREQDTKRLNDALEVLIQNCPQLEITLSIATNLPALSQEQINCLIRVVQECMTNSLRHSESTTLSISINKDNGVVIATIQDGGKQKVDYHPGNGLKGMKERLSEVNGELVIDASHGFTIQAKVPVSE